jgi:hypothetical protein
MSAAGNKIRLEMGLILLVMARLGGIEELNY